MQRLASAALYGCDPRNSASREEGTHPESEKLAEISRGYALGIETLGGVYEVVGLPRPRWCWCC